MTETREAGPHGSAVPARRLDSLLAELEWRGLLHDHTPGLRARLATNELIAGYNGFDPSGPSLHIGSLVPVFGLLHLQRHGGRPVVLIGGATGMIGDPSGTSAERNLLDRDTLDANVAAIRSQLERFVDFSPGPTAAVVVNNLDWLGPTPMLEFLRDVGKHFTIPYMLAKDSVQSRMTAGLSYTEFSYMLLQAADFRHLFRSMGVELQMGGADQWGNITAGLELIRRSSPGSEGVELAHALAYPLLLDATGKKFGKTASGTSVWLDPQLTSPYAFYQSFIDRPDSEMPQLLRFFTLFDAAEIEALEADQAAHPEQRPAQKALAFDITARVHGRDEAEAVRAASEAFFSPQPIRDPKLLERLYGTVDSFEVSQAVRTAGEFAISSNTYVSRSDLRRAIQQGSFVVNGERITDIDQDITELASGEYVEVRTGKTRKRIGRIVR